LVWRRREEIESENRFLRFQSGGKDSEFWAGHFGAQMKDGYVVVSGAAVEGVVSFTNEKKIPITIPFGSSFSDGIGNHLTFHGKVSPQQQQNSFSLQFSSNSTKIFFFHLF